MVSKSIMVKNVVLDYFYRVQLEESYCLRSRDSDWERHLRPGCLILRLRYLTAAACTVTLLESGDRHWSRYSLSKAWSLRARAA